VEVVQLRDTRDPSSLRFEITASLTRSASGERVSFDTLVDSSGRIRIVKE
jgi:predicted component of type VI protein secretion system